MKPKHKYVKAIVKHHFGSHFHIVVAYENKILEWISTIEYEINEVGSLQCVCPGRLRTSENNECNSSEHFV